MRKMGVLKIFAEVVRLRQSLVCLTQNHAFSTSTGDVEGPKNETTFLDANPGTGFDTSGSMIRERTKQNHANHTYIPCSPERQCERVRPARNYLIQSDTHAVHRVCK